MKKLILASALFLLGCTAGATIAKEFPRVDGWIEWKVANSPLCWEEHKEFVGQLLYSKVPDGYVLYFREQDAHSGEAKTINTQLLFVKDLEHDWIKENE